MTAKIQFDPQVILTVDNGHKKVTIKSTGEVKHMVEIHFSLPFGSDPVPNVCTVTLFNLSRETRAIFKKSAHVVLQAGYKGDVGVLTEGNINRIQPLQWSGVDSQFIFTFIEGTDYTAKGDVSKTFKKGTSALTIIKTVASKANIPISPIHLKHDRKYANGYTADGAPLDIIQEVAQKCGSTIRVVRGKYKIVENVVSNKAADFLLSFTTGLTEEPTYSTASLRTRL